MAVTLLAAWNERAADERFALAPLDIRSSRPRTGWFPRNTQYCPHLPPSIPRQTAAKLHLMSMTETVLCCYGA